MKSLKIEMNIKLMVRALVLCLFVLALMCFGANATYAQDHTTPSRGFQPGGSYALSELESISNTNGNLMLHIPLTSLPEGRGGSLSANLSLIYNSKLWDIPPVQVPDPNNSQHSVTRYYINNSPQSGWRYGFEYKLQLIDKLDEYLYSAYKPNCETDAAAGTDYASRRWKLQMIFPDGSVHEFVPQWYQDALHTYGDGYFNIRPDGTLTHCVCHHDLSSWTCSQPSDPVTTNTMTYYSIDGTYLRLDIPHDTSTNMTNKAWTLYFSDGRKVTNNGITDTSGSGYASGPERIYDRNNNYIEIQHITLNSHPAVKIVDQLNRSITIEYGAAANQDNIYSTGTNGEALQWAIKWKIIYINKTYYIDDYSTAYSSSLTRYLTVIDQIILPSQSGNLAYTFNYDGTAPNDPNWGTPTPSVGWGELSSVTLPSGAQANYIYRRNNENNLHWYEVLQNHPTQKDLKYLSEYDGTSTLTTETWHYDFNFSPSRSGISTLTKITSPGGGVTTDYIKNSGYLTPAFDDTLSYRTENSDGTVVERLWKPNAPAGYYNNNANGCFSVNCNAFVKTEYTSIKHAIGDSVPARTAIKDYSYDKNGNVTTVKEYDWVDYASVSRDTNGNPTGIPASAILKRVATNVYYNATPDATDTSTDSPYAYNRPGLIYIHSAVQASELSLDGVTATTHTEFTYDDASTTGNLTQQKSWNSEKGTYSNPLISSNSISISRQYDGYGNVILATDARGYQTRYIYDAVGGYTDLYPTQVKAAYGTEVERTTEQQYDFYTGLVTQLTDADNSVSTQTTYDVFGRPTLVKAALGKPEETRTSTSYDDAARRVIVRSDLNAMGDGKLVEVQHYDQLGRVRLTRQLEDAATQNETDEQQGIKVQTRYLTDAANHFTYQLISNPYRATTSGGSSGEETMGWTRSKRDIGGRAIEVAMFSGSSLPAPWGTNSSTTGSVTTAYDAEFTTATDQAGKVRRSMIDGLGRLVRVDEPDSNNNLGLKTAPAQATYYAYNALGNLTQVSQGAQTRTFAYSSLSRLTSVSNPESGTVEYRYDDNGNLGLRIDSRTRLGSVTLSNCSIPYTGSNTAICTEYDALNRVKTRTYNDGTPNVTYTYDTLANGKGRLTSVSNSVSTSAYTSYDALGRVTGSSQTTDGVTYSMPSYVYNKAGALTSETYPSGRVVVTQYDSAGKLAGVLNQSPLRYYVGGSPNDQNNRAQYTASGAVKAIKLGNGLWEHTNFNSRLQTTQIGLGTTATDSSILKLDYTYGVLDANNQLDAAKNNGNVQSQVITLQGGTAITQSYDYDELNRLEVAKENGGSSWKQTFSYDRYGNRTFDVGNTYMPTPFPSPLPNPSISPSDNRINSSGYVYDPSGNLTTGPGLTYITDYTYDAENRMTKADDRHSFGVNDYVYDSIGRRVKKVTGSGTNITIFVYDALGRLVAEYDNSTTPPTNQTSYLTGDNLGTPRVITDKNQSVQARHDYLPFGEEIPSNIGGRSQQNWGYGASDNISQKFTQKERDAETGLDYFEARYYAGKQGRFTSIDPYNIVTEARKTADAKKGEAQFITYLSNPQRWARYTYALNNPLLYTDPHGEDVTIYYRPPRAGAGSKEDYGHILIYVKNDETGESAYFDYIATGDYNNLGATQLNGVTQERINAHASITIETNASQEQAILNGIKSMQKSAPDYSVSPSQAVTHSESTCTSLAIKLLALGGINVGPAVAPQTPTSVWQSAFKQYGDFEANRGYLPPPNPLDPRAAPITNGYDNDPKVDPGQEYGHDPRGQARVLDKNATNNFTMTFKGGKRVQP